MKISKLLNKLWVENKEFVTTEVLKSYCEKLHLDYDTTVKNFVHRGHLTRIFRGTFYVRPPEGMVLGRERYNHLELVAKGMELKGVRIWYFGLHSALKLNSMTHEYFAIEKVISDSVFRQKPIKIAGRHFNFTKIAPSLLDFGIKKEGLLRYSDPEKTILDFVYLWRQEGKDNERIVMDVSEWAENASQKKMQRYAGHYPKSVARMVDRLAH